MTQQREHWGSRMGFILAAAGSAIGLGSLWRFPYVAGDNGGGSFVLLYLFFTFVFGVPLFVAELIIGRHTQKGPVGAYFEMSGHSQNWKLAGWLCIFSCFTILSFYNVVSGWALNYVLMSLNQFTAGRSSAEIEGVFGTLYQSGEICLFWHFIFMLMTMGVVWGGVRKGIEYWTRLLMPILLIILLALFVYGMTLEGFSDAFSFIFSPDMSRLKPSGVLSALGMALFTLSLGLGIVLTYGSYLKSDDNLPKTSLIIQALNISVTLLASLIIFPIIFTFNLEPSAGPGLVFKTLPVLFEQLPGTLVLSTVFFVLMVFTALTSTVSLMEVLIANFTEILDWSRKKTVIIVGAAAFLFGIPSALAGSGMLFPNWTTMYGKDFLTTLNDLADWQLPIGGLLISIFAGWVVDKALLRKEFTQGASTFRYFFKPWLFFIRWVIPLGILLIILQQGKLIDVDQLFNVAFPGKKQ